MSYLEELRDSLSSKTFHVAACCDVIIQDTKRVQDFGNMKQLQIFLS